MQFRLILFLLLFLYACSGNQHDIPETPVDDVPQNSLAQDTLHVTTLYGPSSYFSYGGEIMGPDVEMLEQFAGYVDRPFVIHLAETLSEMTEMLKTGKVDLIACDVFESSSLKSDFSFVAHQEDSYLVLVQQIGFNTVTDIRELKGKTIHVAENSLNHLRLQNLNREIGGGINIVAVSDSVSEEKLIEKLIKKEISFTVAHQKTAKMYKENSRKLDYRVALGFMQRNGWIVNKSDDELAKQINDWSNLPETETLRMAIDEKYNYRNPFFLKSKVRIPKGAISPYDHFFKKYAVEILWDWRLLASVAFHESGFDSSRISYKGASGLMQLMPRTAAGFGLNRSNITNPEKNIEAGVQYIKSLNLLYRKIENKDERIKFILASYNSGPAHILDAMALAKKYGKNPYVWFDHVEYYLSKKNEPEFYNDEVCKNGSFRAGTTIQYVKNTLNTYHKYKGGL